MKLLKKGQIELLSKQRFELKQVTVGSGWAGDGYDKSGKGDHDGVYHWDADKGEVKNTLPEYLRHDQHGHPGWRGPYLVRKADDVGRLADSNPNPYHGITMCTGMYITGAEPVMEIPKFAGRINFVQIRDLDARWPAAREAFPGTGNLDFKEILRQLLRAGYSGFLHPEHLGNPRWPGEDQVLEATKVLKTWVDEVEAEAEFQ